MNLLGIFYLLFFTCSLNDNERKNVRKDPELKHRRSEQIEEDKFGLKVALGSDIAISFPKSKQ